MKKYLKGIRRYFIYLIVKVFVSLIMYLPFKAKSSIGAFGGRISYLILKKDRKKANENIRFVFKNKFSEKEVKDIAKISFINLGRNLIEALHIPKISPSDLKDYVSFEGLDHLDEALKKGKGVIIITAHIGSWEFFPASVSMIGYHTAVIARRYSNPWIDGMLKNLRAFHGTKVIIRKKGSENQMIKDAFKVLRNNEMLGFLIDQYTRRGFVYVDFFGKQATAPTGPAVFAMRTGAAVLPGCAVRKDKYNFLVKFYPSEEVIVTGDKEKDILANTANFTKAIERMIVEYPYQWAWMHDRWKMKKWQMANGKWQNLENVVAEQSSAFNQKPETQNLKLPLVEIYTKPDCSLCDEAKKLLMNVKEALPFSLKETDITSDNELFEKYKEQIPVIFINGKKAFKFRVNKEELGKKLIREKNT